MSLHYTREPGEEGSVLTAEGDAAGTDLATILAMERPPLRAALEIGSALADILTISEEDGAIHGDIKPGCIRLDATGAVSIDGFGVPRRSTRAPEGRPDSVKADVFGLGVVLHSLLSNEPLGMLPRDAESHDNAVVDRVLAMDFSEVQGRRWLEDVQQFLCKIMAFDPHERPPPLDAANVLAHVAAQCPGQNLAQWASRAIGHAGGAPARKPGTPIAEDLTGPQRVSGPMAAPVDLKTSTRTAPSAKGESTAFWSREKIAALLADQDDDSDELPPAQNTRAPRGAPPALPPEPPKTARGAPPAALPPEPRSSGRGRPATAPPEDLGGPVRSNWSSPQAGLPQAPPPPAWKDDSAPFNPVTPGLPPDSPSEEFFRGGDAMDPSARPGPPIRGPIASGPVAGPVAQGPVIAGPVATGPSVTPDSSGSNSKMKWIIIGVVALVIGCAGVAGVGALAMFTLRPGTDEAPADIEAEVEPGPVEKADTGGPKPGEQAPEPTKEEAIKAEEPTKAEAEPTPKTPETTPKTTSTGSGVKSSGASSGGTKSSGTTGTRSTSKATTTPPKTTPPPEPTPMIAAGKIDARITFADAAASVQVSCGDGQTRKFSGTTSMTFEGTQNCRIKAGDALGVFTASRSGSITCSASGSNVSCTGP